MAGTKGQSSGLDLSVYFNTGTLSTLATANKPIFTDIVGSGKLVDSTDLSSNRVDLVNEIGEPSATLNSFDVTSFGAVTNSITIPLPTTLDDYSITLNLDNSNAEHTAIVDAANGTDYEIAIYEKDSTGETAWYGTGKIGSKHPVFTKDGNTTYVVGLTQTTAMVRLNKA